ncbi:MAG: cupin domain-containing protein [Chloroflexota bacterium]|nr:cupin domain-containing protein [Chloroflexota bacterium]MDE3194560.1 cupin domain-containing protein [Chloroflexota bacterium]
MPKLYFASARDLPTSRPQPGVAERSLHGEHVTLRCEDLDARTIVETHKHEDERVGVVTRGSIAMVVAGEQRILTEGDTYVVPAGAAHGIRVLEQGAQVIEASRTD